MTTMKLNPTRYLATALVLGGVAGALTAMRSPGRAPATMRIVARDFGYDLPATVPAGPTRLTLVNHGRELHHAQLLRLEQGKTLKDLATLPPDGPPPSWLVPLGGPNAVGPGDSSSVIQSLAPGEYAVICVIPGADNQPHLSKGMAAGFQVTEPGNAIARMPAADATIRMLDYGFAPAAPLDAGDRVIRVVNDGPQVHELVMAKLAPGKTAHDYLAWSESGFAGPPPARFVGGVVGLVPGRDALFPVTLEAGNYLLICYVPDARDGKPHVAHGMLLPFTVGGGAATGEP
jgi:uncharacterized cupredoxin-like copper-binding protein